MKPYKVVKQSSRDGFEQSVADMVKNGYRLVHFEIVPRRPESEYTYHYIALMEREAQHD